MKKYVIILSVLCGVCFVQSAHAQKWGVKSNILYDATTSMNIGVEFALSERWTFDMSGNYNPWTFAENKKWKHWFVQPEVRYWTCKRFGGHFLAAHLWGGEYNVGNISGIPDFLGTKFSNLKEHRYEGWFTGIGIAYGYAWMLGKHWNLEAEIGWAMHIRVTINICARDAALRSAAAITTISGRPRPRSILFICSEKDVTHE